MVEELGTRSITKPREKRERAGAMSKVANYDGLTVHSQQLNKPWGEGRYVAGMLCENPAPTFSSF